MKRLRPIAMAGAALIVVALYLFQRSRRMAQGLVASEARAAHQQCDVLAAQRALRPAFLCRLLEGGGGVDAGGFGADLGVERPDGSQ